MATTLGTHRTRVGALPGPAIANLSPFSPTTTMDAVGVVEVVAGVVVALHPRLGGAVVALWPLRK